MRIISKFNDYYDGVQSIGYDPELCYVRDNIDPIEGDFFDSNLLRYRTDYDKIDKYPRLIFDFYIIGFCGEFYPLLILNKINMNKINVPQYKNYFCYSIEDVDKSVKKMKFKNFSKIYYNDKNQKYRNFFDSIYKRKNLKLFFSKEFRDDPSILNNRYFFNDKNNQHIKNFNYLKILFFEYKVPVFVIYFLEAKGQYLKLNPCLKDYNFQRIKDPYTAYQEISQYISGVLGVNTSETIDISDKDKLWEKGFDNWSFKKMPTKKKL